MAISYRAGNSAVVQALTASVTVPATTQVGDLIVAHIFTGGTSLTVPSGYTQIGSTVTDGTTWVGQIVYKVATSSDPGSTISWTVASAATKSALGVAVYAGVDTANPIDASGVAAGTASTSHATPSITVVNANSWMLSFCADRGSASSTSLTPGGGFTTRASAYGTGGGSYSLAIADSNASVSTGAQTAGTWTATVSTAASMVASVSLKPASVSGVQGTLEWFGQAGVGLMTGGFNLPSDTLKLALVTSTYAFNKDGHDFFNDITNELPTAQGYTAGGATVTGGAVSYDSANDRSVFTCNPITWTVTSGTLTFRRGILYKSTGTPSTSRLIASLDFGSDVNATVTFTVYNDPVSGLLVLSTP